LLVVRVGETKKVDSGRGLRGRDRREERSAMFWIDFWWVSKINN